MSPSERAPQAIPFGDLLRQLRLTAALTQEELAELAGLSAKTIGNLERGQGRPYRRSVRLLADALKLAGAGREEFMAAPAGQRDRDEDLTRHLDGRAGLVLLPSSAGQGGAGPAPRAVAGGRVISAQPVPEAVARRPVPVSGLPVAGGAGGTVAIRTLPRDTAGFTGRRSELARLTAVAAAAGGVVCIQAIGGMAGVGKTALAVHAAHQLASRFPDGQLFVPLHGHTHGYCPVDPADALAGLLVTVGFAPAQIPPGLTERAGLWRDHLAGKRVLLVLDDAAGSEQVEPLLPGMGGSLVLVTGRQHLTALADAQVISLDVLSPREASALLIRLAARPALRPDDPAIAQISALCGYLPLAIGMMARRLYHHPAWTPAGLAADLTAAQDRLDLMTAENVSVAAGFDLSYADLTDGQRRLFRRLGLHPGSDIDAYAAAALDGCSLASARRRLAALYDHYLLTEPDAGRYRLHDLLREHAHALAIRVDPDQDQDRAVGRLLAYYTHTADLAEARLARHTRPAPVSARTAPPSAVPDLHDSAGALAWARAERSNLLACLDQVTGTGQDDRVVALTAALAALLQRDGPWADAVARHATAARAARQSGDQFGEANALNNVAIVRYLTGDHRGSTTDLGLALSIYRDLGDELGQANALSGLGFVRYLTGEYPAAAQALQSALSIYRDLGDQLGQATALKNLGAVRHLTGEYPAAAQALQSALSIYRDLGDQLGQANTLTYLGAIHRLTGDYDSGARTLEVALSIYRDLGHRLGQANTLTDLGILRRATGHYPDATDALQQALSIYRDLGQRQGQANALSNMGAAWRAAGNYPDAAQALQEALSICRDIGERGGEAEVLNEAGTLHRVRGELDQGTACHRQALEAAREISSSGDEAHALAGLARCALAAGRDAEAEASLRQAHQIFQRIGAAETASTAAELDALARETRDHRSH